MNGELKIICVTDGKLCRDDFLVRLELIARQRPDRIILREKELPDAAYQKLASRCLELCARHQTPLVLHSRPAIAQALGVPRLHLPLPILVRQREQCRGFEELGVSVHSPEEARLAEQLGAAYLIAGHIYPTGCKQGVPPRGLSYLRDVAAAVSIPVYAIGGITPERMGEIAGTPAAGVCVMSPLMTCANPESCMKAYRSFSL